MKHCLKILATSVALYFSTETNKSYSQEAINPFAEMKVLANPMLAGELNLTATQATELKILHKEISSDMLRNSGIPGKFDAWEKAIRKELMGTYSKVLLVHQRKRLRQLAIQHLTNPSQDYSFGLTSRFLSKKLGLSKKQVLRTKETFGTHSKLRSKLLSKQKKELAELDKKALQQQLDNLSPSQTRAFKGVLGEIKLLHPK